MHQHHKKPIVPSLTGPDWHLAMCFGCGADNPHGLHADFRFDEESGEVRFKFTPQSHHLGAPGYTHGGILAAIMDEAQGMLCFHVGHLIMTDELNTKYHKATPLYQEFTVRCWISAVRKRRIYSKATIHGTGGDLLVSSRGVWYVLPERITRRLFQTDYPKEEQEYVRGVLEANRKRAKEIRRRLKKNHHPIS